MTKTRRQPGARQDMSKPAKVEVFRPKNRLAEKAVQRDEPAEQLIARAETAVAALTEQIGPELHPEIQELGGRLAALAGEGLSDESALDEIKQDARRLGEVADTLGFENVGQILNSLQELLSGEGLTPKTGELARLHIAALGRLTPSLTPSEDEGRLTHPVARELELATQRLTRKQP